MRRSFFYLVVIFVMLFSCMAFADDGAMVRDNVKAGTLYADKIKAADNAAISPLFLSERSSAPTSPSTGDIYLDDGTNTTTGNPGLRRYTGAAWEDMDVFSIASDAECVTGTETKKVVTPAGLTARIAAPGNIGGTTPSPHIYADAITVTEVDDSYQKFGSATAGESEYYVGINNDSEGDNDDPLEWRTSETPGSGVLMTLSPTGNLAVTGNVAGATFGDDGSISNAELKTLDDGLTTEILVGGGAGSAPVWTTATGSGAPMRGTSPVINTGFTITDGTDTASISHIQETGLGGRLTIGLDETARTLVICDAGDVGMDFGLSVMSPPALVMVNSTGSKNISFSSDGFKTSTSGISFETEYNVDKSIGFRRRADLSGGDFVVFYSDANIELTDTDARQAWLYVDAKVNQVNAETGAAGYDLIKGNVTETDIDTAAQNNLLNLQVASATKFRVDRTGTVYANGNALVEYQEPSTDTLSGNQLYGGRITNYGQTLDAVYTLDPAAAGMSFGFRVVTTVAKYARIDPNASDSLYLDGSTSGDGKYVGLASVAIDNEIWCETSQTGVGTYDWFCVTVSGPWTPEP